MEKQPVLRKIKITFAENSDMHQELIGIIAGILTTIAFVPQVYQTWKNKSAKDLSLIMLVTLTTGVALWLIYGLFKNDLPLILANGVVFFLALILIYFKLTFRNSSSV